jgi:hypothetical protein
VLLPKAMISKYYFVSIFTIIFSIFPSLVYTKGHEDCKLCHKNAKEKKYEFIVEADTKTINPTTDKPYGKADSFCISCHKLHSITSHPVGIVPNAEKVTVPEDALGYSGQEKEITCLSCHNPHPENKNYKYLRWPPENEFNLAQFCLNCHAAYGSKRIG